MDVAFVVTRAVHFGACVWLAGELAFASFIAADLKVAMPNAPAALERRVRKVALYACIAALISGVAWLFIEAASMSGTSIGTALHAGTVQVVLHDTSFGRAFAFRGIAFVALVASLGAFAYAPGGRARSLVRALALVVATFELVTLAFVGHAAAAGEGAVGNAHIGADALHLAAAGAWLGALPPLVDCLARPVPIAALARIARRFSVLGMIAVLTLIATGIVNTLFLVGSVPALFGTAYGRALLAKLAVFVAMLALAAVNRFRWTPRIAASDAGAVHSLRRNAVLEVAGGIVVIAIVGALGTMVPGAHQSPRWPFPYTLGVVPAGAGDGARIALASGIIAAAGIALIIAGVRRHALRLSVPGVLAIALSLLVSTSLFAVPAYPTTYATSPVPYAVGAVARGADDYAANCSRCHGPGGRGDGPEAAALRIKPKNLVEHVPHHRPGNLFWWIAHGVAGTPMPGFSPALSDPRIWQLVQYLIAQASADSAASIGLRIDVHSAVRVPDFTYESDGGTQQTLRAQAAPALVVLYSLPGSAARLAELAGDHRLMHAPLRVVTVPLASPTAHEGAPTRVDPDVARVYAMFATHGDGRPAPHAELLIDATGVLRARWLGLPDADSDRYAQIADALRHLPKAAPNAEAMHHHGH